MSEVTAQAVTDETTIQRMWKNLNLMFGLDKSHPDDEIKVIVEGENITLKIRENVFYHTEKRMMTQEEWAALQSWLDEKTLLDLPAIMPRTFSECSATELMTIDEEDEDEKGSLGENEVLGENEEQGEKNTQEVSGKKEESAEKGEVEGEKIVKRNGSEAEMLNIVMERMNAQETKMDKLVEIVNNFCISSIKATEQMTGSIHQIKESLKIKNKEAVSQQTLTDLTVLLREDYVKQNIRMRDTIYTLGEIAKAFRIEKKAKANNEEDEATRRDKEEDKEVRSTNLARGETKIRCYECQDYGHIGAECPNKGRGIKCYKCNKFGSHVAASCPTQASTPRYVVRGRGHRGRDSRY
ncbi:uncharacterized protein LOC122506407 [Leptopilina heterotoma]|uniref:uncharacterized protein LOC122506407 n=1 Tax=Leptopilina heterotoma TaxID=63436 RepID=UPI001CA898DF|nr:uncharacterized protein LOC122506407 [Leptopilina heterotoma]